MSGTPDQPPRGDEFAPLEYPADPGPPPGYPVPGYYGGHPGYPPDPYDPYRPPSPSGTNGKAIAALVVALAGLLCCGIPSLAGFVLGVFAMAETRRTGQDGYGIALAGVIIGAVVIALWALYLGVVLLGVLTGAGPPA